MKDSERDKNFEETDLFRYMQNLYFIHIGEANGGPYIDRYTCSFARMTTRRREIWNERTNGVTDIQFPFGFVQVDFALS